MKTTLTSASIFAHIARIARFASIADQIATHAIDAYSAAYTLGQVHAINGAPLPQGSSVYEAHETFMMLNPQARSAIHYAIVRGTLHGYIGYERMADTQLIADITP